MNNVHRHSLDAAAACVLTRARSEPYHNTSEVVTVSRAESLVSEVEKLSGPELQEFIALLRDKLELWGLMMLTEATIVCVR